MLRCIAVDDEPLALELLEDNIRQVPFLELVATCQNPREAMKVLETQTVDLMFLDIQMPGLTGLQFLQSLTQRPMVVLITAYEKHALEAFDLDVVDYLVKPVSLERFVKACNKARDLFNLRKGRFPSGTQAEFFFVPVDYSMQKINFSDIVMVEGLKDYVKIHLAGSSRPIITRMSMKQIEDELPANSFLRIHKSYIVSIKQISAIRKNSLFIGGHELPVGESYRELVGQLTGKGI